jgi:hypothetical protein
MFFLCRWDNPLEIMRSLREVSRQQQDHLPEKKPEHGLSFKDAEYKAWQERTQKKLLAYALAAQKDPLKKEVLETYIDQTSTKLKVPTRARWMVNNDDIRWQHEGLIKAGENVHDINYEVEWRLEDEAYAEERSNLSDLAFSVKSAFKESQRLRYPNSIHEGELEIAGQKEVLGALREAGRRAKFIIAHTPQEQPTEIKPDR